MRDPLLNEALKRLAAEAATRFSTLVASGERIPFDVAEQDGGDSLFYRYLPLTAQFVRERAAELRALPSFETAREAVDGAGIAARYLEARGEAIPADPGACAERMLTCFIASLWDGCGEFALDRERLDGALAVLDAEVSDADEAEVLIAPLVGLRMPLRRLRLPNGVQVVRADAFEAPLEALRSEGMGRAAWEPQYLALAEQGEGSDSAEAALRQLRELISVMRLFKAGGIGLGPYAFAPTGEGRWRRVATGAAPTRPGGYELSRDEGEELVDLARELEARPDPDGALAWALRRFELGLDRPAPLDGLSDHLLALRSLLGGQGPVGASLPMRAAALIAPESDGRAAAGERIERALELERALMGGGGVEGAAELARWVEEGARGMLRAAALGELGTDLGTAADETLIATGLAEGDAQITVSADELPAQVSFDVDDTPAPARFESRLEEEEDMESTRILEPIPAEGEIRIIATNWLDEVEADAGLRRSDGIAAFQERLDAPRERIDTPRVRHLFPVPDAEWNIRELDYNHYRQQAG